MPLIIEKFGYRHKFGMEGCNTGQACGAEFEPVPKFLNLFISLEFLKNNLQTVFVFGGINEIVVRVKPVGTVGLEV